MEAVPLLDPYNAASSSSSNQQGSTNIHISTKCSADVGMGHLKSLPRQHSHHSTSSYHQHSSHEKNSARSTTKQYHNHKLNSECQESGSLTSETSDQLTLRPPATFSDLNPISEIPSSFQGSRNAIGHGNQQIVRAHQSSSNSSSVMTSNQHGSVADVVETAKSSNFSNASAESLVSFANQ